MKKILFCRILALFLLQMILASSSIGGTIVTDDTKKWAKRALKKERQPIKTTLLSKVGVLNFKNNTQISSMDLLQKGIPLLLIRDLSKIKTIKVAPRERVQALLEETKTPLSNINQRETAIWIGGLLGVEYIVAGEIKKTGPDNFMFESGIFDVRSKKLLGSVSSEGSLFQEMIRMEKELLFKITDMIKIKISPFDRTEMTKPLTKKIGSILYHFKAVERIDQKDYISAKDLCLQVLAKDPKFDPAFEAIYEMTKLDLLQAEAGQTKKNAEAYSEPERQAEKTILEKKEIKFDDRKPEEKTPEEGKALIFTPEIVDPEVIISEDEDANLSILHIRTGSSRDMIVDESCLQKALDDSVEDIYLKENIDKKKTIPGIFSPDGLTAGFQGKWSEQIYGVEGIYGYENENLGLQTVGQNGYEGTPRLLLHEKTLDRINNDGLLAYAVQMEEDRLNKKIMEMHDSRIIESALYTAEKYRGIRERDAWLARRADAQAGRVLKDRRGNWVRVQQYILRPDTETVQLLNVCLRSGSGELSGISTVNWTTNFSESYTGDLRNLPWSTWLDSNETALENRIERYVSGALGIKPPLLESMTVTFSNPNHEFFMSKRTFNDSFIENFNDYRQVITGESLRLDNGDSVNSFEYTADASPKNGEFRPDYSATIDNGFGYVLGSVKNKINIDFFVVGDGDRPENRGEISGYGGNLKFNDIWDSLRVNETGAATIGNNNLEIEIDPEKRFFKKPVNVIYIPMSRMLWKSEPYQ